MNDIVVERGFSARLEALIGRRVDTSILIAFVAVLVLGGLFVWSRKPAAAIAPPATAAPTVATTPAVTAELFVHVAGAVKRPGLYALPPGARVADAVEAAGGPTARAELGLLNLAESLADGVKVDVPLRGESPAPAAPGGAVAGGSPAPVSLNSADQATLETIPGIGPVTAAAILAYREEAGAFGAIEQLLEVSGIGPATLEEIRPYVTL